MKFFLTRVGAHLSQKQIGKLNSALNYLEAGRWMHAKRFKPPRFANRTQLHEYVGHPFADQRVCYLEFGVREGYILQQWANRLIHAATQLHGFDSFAGLPEDWDSLRPKGSFAAQVPHFSDSRITLHEGWFHEILPSFQIPNCEQLIIHLDADLYSSTKIVLDTLSPRNGAILIFDEFCDRYHEMKAFDEYLSNGLRVDCLGATRTFEQVAFQVY